MSQQGQWQVAGSAPEVYERELVPAVFGVWAPILVELAQPRPGERVVDVAIGVGPRADSQAPSRAMAGSAAIFGVSAPPTIGHARSCGVSCEMGASVARSTANASIPFAAQSARACSP